jgi:hypothetical protein
LHTHMRTFNYVKIDERFSFRLIKMWRVYFLQTKLFTRFAGDTSRDNFISAFCL